MSGPENALERWSRRKREAAEERAPSKQKEPEAKSEQESVLPSAAAEPDKSFDLASLPSLESITAETDIRCFLQEGVPADLRREALRRAWSADPGIRDFVGLVENGWDFNDPDAMVGFGPIEPGEAARMMAQFVLTPADEKKTAQKSETPADQRDLEAEQTRGRQTSAPSPSATSSAETETDTDTDTHVASRDGIDESNRTAGSDD